jgi:hypothetical protein
MDTTSFAPPPAANRACADCATARVNGPPGSICDLCARRREEDAWVAAVEMAHREAHESVPKKYRDVAPNSHGVLDAPVVICGPSASGKTRLACAVLFDRMLVAGKMEPPGATDAVIEQAKRRVMVAGTSRYERAYSIGTAAAWSPEWTAWRAAAVLVVDDLGLEPENAAPALADLLISRCDREQQTLVTTSLDRAQFGARYGEGAIRRMSATRWIVCGGAR